jgi:hypothetical protein
MDVSSTAILTICQLNLHIVWGIDGVIITCYPSGNCQLSIHINVVKVLLSMEAVLGLKDAVNLNVGAETNRLSHRHNNMGVKNKGDIPYFRFDTP